MSEIKNCVNCGKPLTDEEVARNVILCRKHWLESWDDKELKMREARRGHVSSKVNIIGTSTIMTMNSSSSSAAVS